MKAPVCPCSTDVEEPGPHIPSCPYADPDYVPPGFAEGALEVGASALAAMMLTSGEPADGGTDRPWFLTLNSRRFFYDDPEGYPFEIGELAWVLAGIPRFGAHLRAHYSVAQHSAIVARLVYEHGREMGIPPADLYPLCRAALLHDASEAFVLDVPRPMKRLPELAGYRTLEARVQSAIMRHFGLEPDLGERAIKHADLLALASEKASLRPVHGWQAYDVDAAVAGERREIVPMSREDAAALFVSEWLAYFGDPESIGCALTHDTARSFAGRSAWGTRSTGGTP